MNQTNFIKNSLLYFLGNSLSKVVAFLLLPIYSKYISPEDFGYFDISQSYLYLIIPIISLEIYLSMLRFVKESSEAKDTEKIIFNSFSFLLLFVIVILFSLILPYYYPEIKLFSLIISLLVVLILQRFYTSVCRGLGNNKLFVFTGIISSLIVAISNYYMIVYLNMKLDSLFWSAIIGFSYQIIHIELILKIRQYFKFSYFDKQLLKQLLAFSVPLSIGSILFFFLNSYNRFLIENNLGLEANGYFAIAGKFSLAITFLTSAFTMAWQDYSFAPQDPEMKNEHFAKGIKMYYTFLMLSGGIFIFFVSFIFPILINKQYNEAYSLIALSVGATLFSAIGDFITQTFLALKRTKLILFSSIAVTLVCVILGPLLINRFGTNGINLTLIFAYFLNVVIRLIYLQIRFKFDVNYFHYFLLLFYYLLVCFVFSKQNFIYNSVGMVLSIVLLIWFFRAEFQKILSKIKQD